MLRWISGLCVLVVLQVAAAEPAPSQTLELQARAADAFVDSIGVNIHLGYNDTTYKDYDGLIKPRLIELGIRHIRDGLTASRKDVITKLNDLGASGIHSILLIKPSEATILIPQLKASIELIEGRNEPDHGEGWEPKVIAEQKALWDAVKNNAETKHIPVVVSAFANTRDSAGKFAKAGASPEILDFGNTHCYPGGLNPISGGWGITFDRAIEEVRKVCGEKPIVCTESGYHNMIEQKGHPGVPPELVAKYQPRLLLHYWNKGLTRTYLYELLDLKPDPQFTDHEKHWGMLNTDGTPKPEFKALANLTALLKDPGDAFAPTKLSVTLEGDLKGLEYTLLQKRDGPFCFVIWQEVKSYDTQKKAPIDNAPRAITLKLSKPAKKIGQYYPTEKADLAAHAEDTDSAVLSVRDDILIVEISN